MAAAPGPRFAREETTERKLQPTDTPPKRLAKQLVALEAGLDRELPKKQLDRNLLIATWNIREFGGITHEWESDSDDEYERDYFSLRVIAEIISRFDVVAVQEVGRNIDALRALIRTLGRNWGVILTDAVKGRRGGGERLAFLFDKRRAIPSGLACELVFPDEVLDAAGGEDEIRQQFARTPYAVAFRSEEATFILVTLHVLFKRERDRLPELKAIADWLHDWAHDTVDRYNHNLIALGDFNIVGEDDELYEAFTSRGLRPPPKLREFPRTLATRYGKPKHYDQIAWFTEDGQAKLTLGYAGRAGAFLFDDYVLEGMSNTDKAARISDHYPLWCEFLLPHVPIPAAEPAAETPSPAHSGPPPARH